MADQTASAGGLSGQGPGWYQADLDYIMAQITKNAPVQGANTTVCQSPTGTAINALYTNPPATAGGGLPAYPTAAGAYALVCFVSDSGVLTPAFWKKFGAC